MNDVRCARCGQLRLASSLVACGCYAAQQAGVQIMSTTPPPLPQTQPFKDDSAKLPMHLLPVDPVQDVVKVLAFGAKKYSANAWREGIAWTRIIDAAERHIASWKKGDDYDKESGLNHLAHAACNLLFLLEYERTAIRLDDRYRTETSGRRLHDVLDGPCMCGATHTSK